MIQGAQRLRKILHINDHYDPVGGAEMLLLRTLDALEERGISNVIVHQHPAGLGAGRRVLYRIPHLADALPPRRGEVVRALRQIVGKEQPDLIHLYNIGNPDVLEECCRSRPTALSVLNHNFYCPGGEKYLPFLRRICTRPFGPGCLASAFLTHCNSIRPPILLGSYRRSFRVMRRRLPLTLLALSSYQVRCLVESGCPPGTVRLLPPFTDLPDLGHPGSPAGNARLLFTGRIVPGKGLAVLLKALRHVREAFLLTVDGTGPALEPCKQLASRLSLEDRVRFVGWAPRAEHLRNYQEAAAVIMPSIWPEPFGMVGIEAMSYGKPVVAFNVGGISEWLDDGATGFLIRPHDVEGLGGKIDYLLQHPDVAHQMGMRGRRRVEEDFTKEKHIPRLLEVYQEVADARGDPSGG